MSQKFLQYFDNVRHNQAASDTGAKVVKVKKTFLDCEMLNSPDTLWVHFCLAAEFQNQVLDLPDLSWLSRFLQSEQSYSNCLITIMWSTEPSPFIQRLFLVVFVAVWTWVPKLDGTFIYAAFTSCMGWSHAQCVCALTTMILPDSGDTFHGFNWCGYIYVSCKSKVGDCSREWPEDSLFNSGNIEMSGRALLLSLDCSTLPLILTL